MTVHSASHGHGVATTLNETVIQELASMSFALSGLAERAARFAPEDVALAAELRAVAATLRQSIGALRALIVELHPPALAAGGLESALNDAASLLRLRGMTVEVEVDVAVEVAVDAAAELRLYAALTEALAAVGRHPSSSAVRIQITRA